MRKFLSSQYLGAAPGRSPDRARRGSRSVSLGQKAPMRPATAIYHYLLRSCHECLHTVKDENDL